MVFTRRDTMDLNEVALRAHAKADLEIGRKLLVRARDTERARLETAAIEHTRRLVQVGALERVRTAANDFAAALEHAAKVLPPSTQNNAGNGAFSNYASAIEPLIDSYSRSSRAAMAAASSASMPIGLGSPGTGR